MMKIARSGNFLVSIAALLWGTSFVAIKWGYENSSIEPILFVFLRFSVATLLFLPFSFYFVKEMKKLLLSKQIIILGFFNACSFLLQFLGQPHTTAGKASLFVNFYAITVPILAPLVLPERYSWRVIISSLLGFGGAFFVTTNLDFTNLRGGTLIGDLFTLGSGGAWTLYILYSKKYLEKQKKISGIDVFFGTIVWTTVFLLFTIPFAFLNKSWEEIITQFTPYSILAIIYLAVVCTVGAFAIYMVGLKKAEAGESAIFMLLEVVVAFLFEAILLHTIPHLWEIVGAIMIVLAMTITSLKFARLKEEKLGKANIGEQELQK
ncbi:MAG: DMT family transporter [Candidatus Heimdallarchaeaceae archaeon]